jgi:hypothetical protein
MNLVKKSEVIWKQIENFEKAVRKKYVIFIEFCMKWDPFSNLNLELMSARD